MRLRKNILTSLISALFLVIMGYSCYQMGFLTIANAINPNSTGGLIVFAILIFLIAAYFLKERNYFQFFESNRSIIILVEAFVVIVTEAATWLTDSNDNLNWKVYVAVTLLLIYLTARLAGGRMSGLIAIVTGWIFMNNLCINLLEHGDYLLIISFLAPYGIFLLTMKYLVKLPSTTGFMYLICILNAIVYAFCIVMNPMTIFLVGFIFINLLDGKGNPSSIEKNRYSPFSSGLRCALLLLLFTIISLIVINLFFCQMEGLALSDMPVLDKLIEPFVPAVDKIFTSGLGFPEIADFAIRKFDALLDIMYSPFQYGAVPTLLLFLAVMAGVHTITKEYSYLKPLVMSFSGLFIMYLLYAVKGSDFIYLYFMTPIFAGYGFSNFLIMDPLESAEESVWIKPMGEEERKTMEEYAVSEEANKEAEQVANRPDDPNEKEVVPAFISNEEKNLESKQDNEFPEWMIDPALEEEMEEAEPVLAEPAMIDPEPAINFYQQQNDETDSKEAISDDIIVADKEEAEEEPLLPLDQIQNNNEVEEIKDLSAKDITLAKLGQVDTGLHDGKHDVEQFLNNHAIDEAHIKKEDTEDSMSMITEPVNPSNEEDQLNVLLERLDLSENIRRMNASAQEDIAEVIEKTSQGNELEEAVPVQDMAVIEEEGVFIAKEEVIEDPCLVQPHEVETIEQREEIKQFEEEKESTLFSLDDLMASDEPIPAVFDSEMVIPPEEQGKLTIEPSPIAAKEEELEWDGFIDDVSESEVDHMAEEIEPCTKKEESKIVLKTEKVEKQTITGKRSYHKITIK